jgi:hypothetical protein
MRIMKKRDLNHPSSTVNLEYCTQVFVIRTTALAQITCEEKLSIVAMIIDKIHVREIDSMSCAPQNKTCETVPRAAIMCEGCVIIVPVEEGELNIDRCSAEISEP